MRAIYDVFSDEYIKESDIDPIAPPERYKEITEELLISNATCLLDQETEDMREGEHET